MSRLKWCRWRKKIKEKSRFGVGGCRASCFPVVERGGLKGGCDIRGGLKGAVGRGLYASGGTGLEKGTS